MGMRWYLQSRGWLFNAVPPSAAGGSLGIVGIIPDQFTHRAAGINWYCEQRGSGPYLVLIPSGEGDCASFEPVAAALAHSFTVLTFDTPGFSRTSAPVSPGDLSMSMLGGQIAALIASLSIDKATFYGCSSGGVAALQLVRDHADLVRNVVVHEVAVRDHAQLPGASRGAALVGLDDAAVVSGCRELYESVFNEDGAAWRALGADYHARLERNYLTWIRHYVADPTSRVSFHPPDLANRPIAWTIGGLSQVQAFFSNVRLSHRAGIDMGILMCRHFPQVSIPTGLVEHIRASTSRYA